MKLYRIGIVVLAGCVALVGLGVIKYRQFSKTGNGGGALLESSLTPVGGEDEIPGLPREAPDHNPGIYYEGTLLAYDREENRLYLPQNCGEAEMYGELSAVIDGESRPLYILRDDLELLTEREKRMEAVRNSHDFALYVPAGGGEYYKFLLAITGMPLISMVTEYEAKGEELPEDADPDERYYGSGTEYYGRFLMMDPGGLGGQYQITEAAVCYHYKGASTSWFEKKSYSIDLLDHRGNKVDVSLAGMRSDSKWKLNSLYTDSSRIREITSSQIWELIDGANGDINESGPNMEYVELIVDNEYRGVYCLVEPIDAKKLDLQKNDILYKVIGWEIPDSESIQESADKGWKLQHPVRIRYPKVINDYQAAWYPMDDYLEIFHRGDIVPYEEAVKHIDPDNFCDMLIFNMVVSGSDNFFKNIYFAAECGDGIENYRMRQVPWDLDYTFGNIYEYGTEMCVVFDGDFQKEYAEETLFRLYEADPEAVVSRLLERWERYRKDFLATDRVIGLLEENREYLLSTGAFMREKERWPQGGVNLDIDYLKEFQRRRMDWLDGYFAAWPYYSSGQ